MKKLGLGLFLSMVFSLSISASQNPVGERAGYILNDSSSRTSWIVKDGSADLIVKEYRNDDELGEGYVVEVKYTLEVRFKGTREGSIGLFVPGLLFEETFVNELKDDHPMSFGSFDIDYLGQTGAKDAQDNWYDQCAMTRIYNIDPDYDPINDGMAQASILWTEHVGFDLDIKDLEIQVTVHNDVPVLGGVQLDFSGVSNGMNVRAGFDFIPM